MLTDILDQSIAAMKEISELEKASHDAQKQEKNDRVYELAVDESYIIADSVSSAMEQFEFLISAEIKNKMEFILRSCMNAVAGDLVDEGVVNNIQKEINNIKKDILKEWQIFYHQIADQKINMLQTVRGIAPEKEKIDYASNKIKIGASWEFKKSNLDKMEKGLSEAESILESLGLTDEVTEFLKKVVLGKANVNDLTPDVLSWLTDKNMSSKLAISFR
ncbi:MAG: hypothetical protein HFI26_03185 [Lachnospiraceae bacterium]|jgi:hypothetical protein|nr:hypothetical protein [Lachnospiraceae bacterium]